MLWLEITTLQVRHSFTCTLRDMCVGSTATICGCDNEMVSLFAANITIGAVKGWLAERLQLELLLNCDEALHVASVCLLIAFV